MAAKQVELAQFPEPKEGNAAVVITGVAPFFGGQGDTDYLCSWCKVVLVRDGNEAQIHWIVFKCPECGTFSKLTEPNQAPPGPPPP